MKRDILSVKRFGFFDHNCKKLFSRYSKIRYKRSTSHQSASDRSLATKKEHRQARHHLNKLSLEVEE